MFVKIKKSSTYGTFNLSKIDGKKDRPPADYRHFRPIGSNKPPKGRSGFSDSLNFPIYREDFFVAGE